jgi:hypothetical protein
MKPNNAPALPGPENNCSDATTEKGATNLEMPGISGRKVAWGLGAFMLFSLITIPLGLFVYQGVSNREKKIQRDWPKVAAELEIGYVALENYLMDTETSPERAKTINLWNEARQTFRSKRVWFEQLQAAQTLEDLLQTPISPDNSSTSIDTSSMNKGRWIDFIASRATDATARLKIVEARNRGVEAYREFESEQLNPYKDALTHFPGNTVLLFFKLPEPPVFRIAEFERPN